ncbi:MAG: ABC transporter substrate-binding protein [Acidimicrobiia bacterium]|nr:ABC transporter substrate-binding protein [Acidimicrobiia bacterium]
MGGVRARRSIRWGASMAAGAALALVVVACGGGDGAASALGDGSLGSVEVGAGESVQIRSLQATTEVGSGPTNDLMVRIAVADYGPIHGFEVNVESLDEGCSPEGGEAGGSLIAADASVAGVVGTTCSVAAIAAAPLVTGAGMTMISPSNTSPLLTSDGAGVPGPHFHEGYWRTAGNDLYQGAAVARFLYDRLGVTAAATVHTGDAYTESLAAAFVANFERLGGRITGTGELADEQTDVAATLRNLAADGPQALFMSVSLTVGTAIVEQRGDVPGLADVPLVANEGLLDRIFMSLPQTAGIYFSSPNVRFGQNTNQGTGASAEEVLANYRDASGADPDGAFWGHAYDATVLLLEAINAASAPDGDALSIDRAGVRQHLSEVSDYQGITGALTCDAWGDCGSQRIDIVEHADPADITFTRTNVVYEYEP